MSSTINHIIPHILSHLSSPPPSRSVTRTNPIFIALQGPQGSGKTYLSSLLLNYLSSHPYNLKLATLSIDDLYLPYSGLQQLRNAHPRDRLLEGRGLPGTHDLALGRQVLDGLKRINDSEDEEKQVLLPIFDKSLHSGFGDRLPLTPTRSRNLTGPIDIVLMEGWCVGFSTISQSELEQRWETMSEEMKGWCRAEHVMDVNERLEAYEELWKFFDVFIQVPLSPFVLPVLSPN
jgi:D-glycerate 3-kinase